jgi:hypothetical protein
MGDQGDFFEQAAKAALGVDRSQMAAARLYVRENLETGIECPCCGQFAKEYRRQIHSTMAAWLCDLVRRWTFERRAYHVGECGPRLRSRTGGGDEAKLRYWKLIEEIPKDPENTATRTSGYWRPTKAGIYFAHRAASTPKYCYVFDTKVLRFDGPRITIVDALGNKFNYAELMGWA